MLYLSKSLRLLFIPLVLILGVVMLPPAMTRAATPSLIIQNRTNDIFVSWDSHQAQTLAELATSLTVSPFNGYQLPVRLLTIPMGEQPLAIQTSTLEYTAWTDLLPEVADVVPETADGEQRPDLSVSPTRELPTAPLSVIRQSWMNGEQVVVVLFSPIFAINGTPQLATRLVATIPLGTAQRSVPQLQAVSGPTNAAANSAAIVVQVQQSGLQRITGAELTAAGWSLTTINATRLRLWRNGQEAALELRGMSGNQLTATSELRFYAAPWHDRWNATAQYWLTVDSQTDGLRMSVRSLSAGSATLRTALQEGEWRQPQLYDSTLPGADGDHWFSADLRTGPGLPAATLTVPLTPTLPVASGSITLTLKGSAYTSGSHKLQVSAAGVTKSTSWSGTGDWVKTLSLNTSATSFTVEVVPGTVQDGLMLDTVTYTRSATLAVNGKGVIFRGQPGTWRYALQGVVSGQELYDITDPLRPQRTSGVSSTFQDSLSARQYLLSGTGSLFTPTLRAYTPQSLPTPANVLYIAPAKLHAALAPLVAYRQTQGYSVTLVDVQQIYDRWNDGGVDPAAIRRFLRYAKSSWSVTLQSVTLVGDGTSDPLNYTARDNETLIPPYLAMVDPWLGEAPCDTCFARLDSDDPLDDSLPDILIGRWPVKNATELAALVTKQLAYEQSTEWGGWRARQLYIADNGTQADGTPDSAGDFATLAEQAIDLQPEKSIIERLYYDPWQKDSAGNPIADASRESDATQAHERVIAAFNAGAALVTYVGHSHYWQWAVTDLNSGDYLLGVSDIGALENGQKLPIVLAMTCLSSAFQQPSYSGTTIDEKLLLHANGGAIAVWGPGGLGVSHGHDQLERGFMKALWESSSTPRLGDLVQEGYRELFTQGSCCQDTLYTYILLGDPLTPARITTAWQAYLPETQR